MRPRKLFNAASRRAVAYPLIVVALVVSGVGISWHYVERERKIALRQVCEGRLKQLALALNNYYDDFGTFPPSAVLDVNGKPIHSWRVLVLPYIEWEEFYDQYDFTQRWDSPHNISLAQAHPEVAESFQSPCDPGAQRGWASYLAVVGPHTLWSRGSLPRREAGPKKILLLEQQETGIHWMQPKDIVLAQATSTISPQQKLVHFVTGDMTVGTFDGLEIVFLRTRHDEFISEWCRIGTRSTSD